MEDLLKDLEEAGKRLYTENKYKEVEEMLSTFLKEGRDDLPPHLKARALNDRGHARYMRVEFDPAVSDYDEALNLLPAGDGGHSHLASVIRYNRGTVHYRMGCGEKALEDLAEAVRLQPDNPEFKEALAKCRKLQG